MSITRFRKRHFHSLRLQRGFTLIELLVVIALIGVLAGVILVVIDPLEQFERGRDAARKSAVRQIVGAIQAYYVSNNATYVPLTTTWITALTLAGELKTAPSAQTGSTSCLAGAGAGATSQEQNNYCYWQNGSEALVWTVLKSKSEKSKCTDATKPVALFYWASANSSSGVYCTNAAYNIPVSPTPL